MKRSQMQMQMHELPVQKLEQLESSMKRELGELKSRSMTLESELRTFSATSAGDLERANETRRQQLLEDRAALARQLDALKSRVRSQAAAVEGARAQLVENETGAQLSNLERKLAHNEQTVAALHESIAARSRDTDFEALRATCLSRLLGTYNKALQDHAAAAPAPY